MGRQALAFSLAAALAVALVASLRIHARRAGQRRWRYLGGAALVAAIVPGWVLAPTNSTRLGAIALGVVGLAVVGSVSEIAPLPRWVSATTLLVATGLAVAAGVETSPGGLGVLEWLLPFGLVLALAASLRRLDETDGVPALLVMMIALGVFALAGFGDQPQLAIIAAALVGSCAGFLVYNSRPASIFLGEPGALSLALLVTCLGLEVRPAVEGAAAPLTLLLLVAVPLFDGAVISVGRFRRGRDAGRQPRDHLLHRLAARGLGRNGALLLIAGAQAALTSCAVFVGRGVISPGWAVTIALAVLAVLASLAVGAPVHEARLLPLGNRARLATVALAVIGLVLIVTGVWSVLDARRLLDDGREAVENALRAAHRGDDATAAAEFGDAARAFDAVQDRLASPAALIGLAVPVLGPNLQAVRDLSSAGAAVSEAGVRLTDNVDPDRLRVVSGTVPLAEVRRITDDLDTGARMLHHVVRDVAAIDRDLLVNPVSDAVDVLRKKLSRADVEAGRVAAASRLAPAILGGDGPRRYFLAVQNSAEQRATGGFIGNWGILTAENGKVDLSDFQRIRVLNDGGSAERTISEPDEYLRRYGRFDPAHTWQNVNMSPNFPTVAKVVSDLYPQSGGEAIDGVIAVDPVGLSALLELTGPVTVEGWPVPLTTNNVVDVTLRDAYAVFVGTDREDFLGDVARTVVDTATSGELGKPADIARVLGRTAREGHLTLWFTRREEQALARRLGVAGTTPRVRSDSMLLTTQNAAGNKLDYYLDRDVDYELKLVPDADETGARVSGEVDLRLDNTVSTDGLSRTVVGPYDDRFAAGENRSFVSFYSPLQFVSVELDGVPSALENDRELGRNVFSSFLSIPAGTTRTLAIGLMGSVHLDAKGWYSLELIRQPGLHPDQISISIAVPRDWRIVDTRGLETDGTTAEGYVSLTQTRSVALRIERAGSPNLWDQLSDGP